MLRVHQSANTAAAENYFHQGLAQEHYYVSAQEIAGQWHGKLAERLGLQGQVQEADFKALLNNRHPETGAQITPRMKKDRNCGYDHVYSTPKSVSLLYTYTGDERIVDAFRQSVQETMQEVEQEMAVRVRQNGQNTDRFTGNLCYAEFLHKTARPVNGVSDPHMHIHAYTMNLTYDKDYENRDGSQGAIMAAKFQDIKRHAPYFEAAAHARLAKRLRDLGYQIERTERDYEIAGIHRDLINDFSQRTQVVESKAQEKGLTYAEDKAKMGAATRQHKEANLTWPQFRESFQQRLTREQQITLNRASQSLPKSRDKPITPALALQHAADERFYNESVTSEKRFLEAALRRGIGSVTPAEVRRELAQQKNILRTNHEGEQVITTRKVLREEQEMLRLAREGRGTCLPLARSEFAFQPIQSSDGSTFELNQEQKNAVTKLLKSHDRTQLVIGRAGTGKSTMLAEFRRGVHENNRKLFAYAPTTTATDVLRQEGFQANTLASLLQNEEEQQKLRGQVMLVDEAGLVGSQDMRKLLEIAQHQNARLVLAGDPQQICSVKRGDALRQLQDQGGLKPALIREVQRQKPTKYKQAASHLNEGNIRQGFQILDQQLGWVHEVADEERPQELAKAYVETTSRKKPDGKFQTAIVVAPTHKEANEVNQHIRQELKQRGRLKGDDHHIRRYVPLHLTPAERRDMVNYQADQIIQFHRSHRTQEDHIPAGSQFRVLGRSKTGIVLRNAQGVHRELPLEAAENFSVYRLQSMPVAQGEIIRFTQNGKGLDGSRITNGQFATVKQFYANRTIELTDGRKISLDHGHLAPGMVSTIDSAQGVSRDHTFLAISSDSFGAANQERFGVAISRGKHQAHIYTDNKQELRAAVERSGQRLTATEVAQQLERESRWVKIREMANKARDYVHRRVEHTKDLAKSRYRSFRETMKTAPQRTQRVAYER